MFGRFADRLVSRLVPRAKAAAGDVSAQAWQYRCTSNFCPEMTSWHRSEKRYCSGGSCSGWEYNGCCP